MADVAMSAFIAECGAEARVYKRIGSVLTIVKDSCEVSPDSAASRLCNIEV
jgi:hypothetical protein